MSKKNFIRVFEGFAGYGGGSFGLKRLKEKMPKFNYEVIGYSEFDRYAAALFDANHKDKKGGYAEFDNFTMVEPMADRSKNIPYGKTFRIINLATGKPAIALEHGMLHDTDGFRPAPSSDKNAEVTSDLTRFRIIDKGQGKVIVQCEDGRYIYCAGFGIAGDVRLTTDESKAEVFLWQDYLNQEFMLMSMRTHKYIGKSPTTGSPYSMDFVGADPARRNGAVLRWE